MLGTVRHVHKFYGKVIKHHSIFSFRFEESKAINYMDAELRARSLLSSHK